MAPGKAQLFQLTTVEMIDWIYEYLDKSDIQMSVFPYLSKAFDTLDHFGRCIEILWVFRHPTAMVSELLVLS